MWHLSLVGKGDTRIPHLLTSKDTGVLVRKLLEMPPGKTLSGAGDMLSWKECLQIWCETQGLIYGGFDEISVDDFIERSGMGPDIGLEFAEMFEFMESPGYNGINPSIIIPKEVRSFNLPLYWVSANVSQWPTTLFATWCRSTDFSELIGRNSIGQEIQQDQVSGRK